MSNSTKRYLITVGLLSVTAFITFGAYSTRSYTGTLYTPSIPLVIENWYGRELTMDERTFQILETRDAIMREYVDPSGGIVLLSVVFAQNNRKVAHPPEVCFAGGGWERMEKMKDESGGMRVNRLVLQKGSQKQVVLYLYKSGDKFTHNYYAQQINIILNSMLKRNTSSALIRISAYTINDNVEETLSLIKRFADDLMPVLEKQIP